MTAGILTAGYIGLQLLAIASRSVPVIFLALLADLAALWFILTGAMAKGRIRKGIEEIASGNLAYRIDLTGLRGRGAAYGGEGQRHRRRPQPGGG